MIPLIRSLKLKGWRKLCAESYSGVCSCLLVAVAIAVSMRALSVLDNKCVFFYLTDEVNVLIHDWPTSCNAEPQIKHAGSEQVLLLFFLC